MVFQKILVPVDTEGYAEEAIEKAIELAKFSEGKVTILHVTSNTEKCRNYIDEVSEKFREAGIEVTNDVKSGSPADVIVSESNNYEVIVMGTSGKMKLITGSVAKAVMKGATCPVMVVKSQR